MARGLDHLVLANSDLAGLADLHRRLGFRLGAENRHPWGTLNHIVQMPGTFLELISTEPGFQRPADTEPVAQFAGFLSDYLARRNGFAMLVLESPDAAADQARLAGHGIAGPSTFRFERTAKRPDGTPVHVAFTLAFARSAGMTDAGFFLCQQHYPENFWNPAFQVHPNTVTGVAAVTFVTGVLARDVRMMERYAGAATVTRPDGVAAIDTGRGIIEIATRAQAEALYGAEALPSGQAGPHWAGVRFKTADPMQAAAHLRSSAVSTIAIGRRLVVPATHAHGTAIAFE